MILLLLLVNTQNPIPGFVRVVSLTKGEVITENIHLYPFSFLIYLASSAIMIIFCNIQILESKYILPLYLEEVNIHYKLDKLSGENGLWLNIHIQLGWSEL